MADEIASGAGMLAGSSVEGNFLDRLRNVEQALSVLQGANMQAAALDEISDDMGDLRGGRFIAATSGWEPTEADFSGVFMSAEGEIFGADTYNIGGVNEGVLQFGLSALDGKAYFMGGAAIMDDGGINLTGVGNLITMEGSTETATRHVNIGMEIGPDTGVPSLTIKSYSPDYGSNLLTNGTFESDTVGSVPANWTNNYTVVQSASGTFVSKFLRFSYSGYNDRNDYSDAINVTEGTTYYFIYHAYIYALAGSPSNIAWSRLRIAWYDVSNALISTTVINQAYSISATPDYYDINAIWSGIAPTGAVTAKINLNYWGKQDVATTPIGYIHVDDLTFCDLSGEATYQIQFDPELTVDGGLTVNGGITGALTGDSTGTHNGAVNTPLITLTEGADPSSPSDGYRALYAKSDGLYQKVPAGTVSRLALASEIPTLTYPEWWMGAFGLFQAYTAAGARFALTQNIAYSSNYSGIIAIAAAGDAADGVYYILNIPLRAGTYAFAMAHIKAAAYGKFDLYVDGTKKSATALDCYASSASYNNQWDVASIVIATDGWHQFKILTNGTSGSDYQIGGGVIMVYRTG